MLSATAAPARRAVRAFARAADLPAAWDGLCPSLLQRRRLLAHYEAANPCGQRYYCLCEDDRPVAGAVVYTIVQNLFTFLRNLPSPVALNVVGLPASISPPGLVGEAAAACELLESVFAAEPGLSLALNLGPEHRVERAVPLRLLPDLVLSNRFDCFAAYVAALRAPWRRRVRLAQERFRGVETTRTGCDAFTAEHHRQYLAVLGHARERLETLGLAFFQGLPPPLELVSCRHEGRLLCWRIMLREGRRLTFVLGGHDYAANGRHASYFNSLLGILEDGMRDGVETIDLGQTAEDAKLRLGARAVEMRMLLAHRRPAVNGLVRLAAPLIACRVRPRAYRVFRAGTVDA